MSWLILILGCECQTIVISLKNGALLHHSSMQGIYQRAGKVNGKTSWISSSNAALWYNAEYNDWVIGPVNYLGTSNGGITSGSQGRSSCPYNVPNDAWKYVDNNGGWIIADANDVSIECLTGNHSFGSLSLLWPLKYTFQISRLSWFLGVLKHWLTNFWLASPFQCDRKTR